MTRSESKDELLERAKSSETPVSLSIRELLSYWGARRRGFWIVEMIERDLAKSGLTTDPPFTDGWIDQKVRLRRAVVEVEQEESLAEPKDQPTPRSSLRVGNLESAGGGVVAVPSEDTLMKAQSIMMKFDFSQLAVMSGHRDLKGAVSWESIAQALLKGDAERVADATVRAQVVQSDDDLISQIPTIIESDFVFRPS